MLQKEDEKSSIVGDYFRVIERLIFFKSFPFLNLLESIIVFLRCL